MFKFLSSLFKGRPATESPAPSKNARWEEPQLASPGMEKSEAMAAQEVPPNQLGPVNHQFYREALAEALDFGVLSSTRTQASMAGPMDSSPPQPVAEIKEKPVTIPPEAAQGAATALVEGGNEPVSAVLPGVSLPCETAGQPMPSVNGNAPAGSSAPDGSLGESSNPRGALAEDVVAAYKLFLGRLPESTEVVQLRIGLPLDKLLFEFMASPEFLASEGRSRLALAVAMQVLVEQKDLLVEAAE